MLRFVELVFDLPALTGRDANADALLDAFDFSGPVCRRRPRRPRDVAAAAPGAWSPRAERAFLETEAAPDHPQARRQLDPLGEQDDVREGAPGLGAMRPAVWRHDQSGAGPGRAGRRSRQ